MMPPNTQAYSSSWPSTSRPPTAPSAATAAAAGFLRHFSDLDDATKYAGINFFMAFNQPPTNDTFCRAARFQAFKLHTGAPWEAVTEEAGQVI
jgi:hypothetical protein